MINCIVMRTNLLTEKIIGKYNLCSLFGHRFVVTKKVNSHFSEYECPVCKKQVTNDQIGKKIRCGGQHSDFKRPARYPATDARRRCMHSPSLP